MTRRRPAELRHGAGAVPRRRLGPHRDARGHGGPPRRRHRRRAAAGCAQTCSRIAGCAEISVSTGRGQRGGAEDVRGRRAERGVGAAREAHRATDACQGKSPWTSRSADATSRRRGGHRAARRRAWRRLPSPTRAPMKASSPATWISPATASCSRSPPASRSASLPTPPTIDLYMGAPAGEIVDLLVTERARGTGIGSALVDEVVRRFEKAGCSQARVVTGTDNAAAMRVYQQGGPQRRSALPPPSLRRR